MIKVSLATIEIIIAVIVLLICGYVLGYSLAKNQHRPIGTLRIDSSDPDGPYMFLELETVPVSVIKKEKYVLLKVDTKSYNSLK